MSDWLFEPSMGPGAIVRHAFFLPKFFSVFFSPTEGSTTLSTVHLLCSLQKGLHLTLVFLQEPTTPLLFFPSFSSERDRKRMQMSNPPELIALSCFLLFSLQQSPSCLFSFFRPVVISHAEPSDILNLSVEAAHHDSSMLVCCLSLFPCRLNLHLPLMFQHPDR